MGTRRRLPDAGEIVRHHLDPITCLENYVPREENLLPLGPVLEVTATGSILNHSWLSESRQEGFRMRDGWVQGNGELRRRIAEANELEPIELTDAEVEDLVVLLCSLTDPSSRDLTALVPQRDPSTSRWRTEPDRLAGVPHVRAAADWDHP